MSKNSSQGRRQMSTHYHDAARQHQEAAHLAKSVAPKAPPDTRKTQPTGIKQPRNKKT